METQRALLEAQRHQYDRLESLMQGMHVDQHETQHHRRLDWKGDGKRSSALEYRSRLSLRSTAATEPEQGVKDMPAAVSITSEERREVDCDNTAKTVCASMVAALRVLTSSLLCSVAGRSYQSYQAASYTLDVA